MKKINLFIAPAILIALGCSISRTYAQANQSLSNLTAPTSVNQHIIPLANNTIDLGNFTTGWRNIFVSNSLYLKGDIAFHAPGPDNFFAGRNAGYSYVSGSTNNTGLGYYALYSNGISNDNTAIGANAMYYNSGGIQNTSVGSFSLNNNSNGSDNTAVGSYALYANTLGSHNTAIGFVSLYQNLGQNNTATGDASLRNNTSGNNNTANGTNALYTNLSGSFNTAIGGNCLYKSTGNSNTAIGYLSMYSNTSGYSNVAIGVKALYSNTTGRNIVAIGDSALYKFNGSGGYNTAIGSKTLYNNTGTNNTATGYQALFNNTSGTYNTANGYYSLRSNTTGLFNTAIGTTALYSSTGSYNTALGSSADVNAGLSNSTAIGFGALATASNQVWLGNTSVTSVKAGNNIVIVSDGRFKKNLKENVPGLAFINQLKPVTYNYDIHGLNKYMKPSGNSTQDEPSKINTGKMQEEAISNKEKIVYTGFIAQDVEKAADKLNYEFSGVYKPQNDKDPYGLNYAEFVVPLVKAVQELDAINNEKDTKIASLQQQIDELKTLVQSLIKNSITTATTVTTLTPASLEQNAPNPFSSNTAIRYKIPSYTTSAQITIINAAGSPVKTFVLKGNGTGTVTVNAGELAAGSYFYTLTVDGKKIDSKQMILIK